MTASQRMSNFFNRENIGRLPAVELVPWWDLTIERWKKEGLDERLSTEGTKRSFGLDVSSLTVIPNGLWDENVPKFKEHGYINDDRDYDKVSPFLYKKEVVHNMRGHFETVREGFEQRGDIVEVNIFGYFWFPRDLFGIEDHLYSFYDHPELYHRICRDMTEYYLFVIDEITEYNSPHFIVISEDMSYNLGPMLSEAAFQEYIAPYYRRIIPAIKQKGIKVIIDSDGDITKMVPWFIETGADGVYPLERQAGVDINFLTSEYPDFFFIGGYDKMVMKFGKEAMIKEFERILPAMRRGNYLPNVDHQAPPDVSLENYRVYAELLKHYCKKCKNH